jgi:hypothetical protein
MKALILNFSIIALFVHQDLSAQPFSSIEIGASLSSVTIFDKSYSKRWKILPAKSLKVRTPFYIGIIGANIDLFEYQAKNSQVSDFTSINFSSYLGLNVLKFKSFSASTGVIVGIQKIETDSPEFDFNSEERELYFAFSLEPKVQINRIILFGDFQYRKIFNYYRQHLLTVGTGIRINLSVSKKVRDFVD